MPLLQLCARCALAGLDLALLGLIVALLQLLLQPALLPVTLTALTIAVLLGALLVSVAPRWEDGRAAALARLGAALVGSLLLLKGGLGGQYVPWSGWHLLTQPLLNPTDPRTVPAYLALLLVLVAIWRGTRLHIPTLLSEIQARFKRGLLLLLALLLGAVLLPEPYRNGARFVGTIAAVAYISAGLLAQALFRETSTAGRDRRLDVRKLLLLLVAISLPLAFTLMLATWFSADAAALISRAYNAMVALLLLIIAPLTALLFAVLDALFRLLFHPGPPLPEQRLPIARPTPTPLPPLSSPGVMLPAWLSHLLPLLPFLIPLAIILVLLMLRPRRTRPADDTTEERELVWSWQSVGSDLQSWLQRRIRRPEQGGMQALLERLRGDDPVHVIRRTYLRLLMRTAHIDQARKPSQTPAEYEATLGAVFRTEPEAVQLLTRSYERARYDPAATTAADAAAILTAWTQLTATPLPSPSQSDGEEHRHT